MNFVFELHLLLAKCGCTYYTVVARRIRAPGIHIRRLTTEHTEVERRNTQELLQLTANTPASTMTK